MSSRTKSRKLALDALYSAALTGRPAQEVLKDHAGARAGRQNQEGIIDYAEALVSGYLQNRERIDYLIADHSENWSLDRMPSIDLALLRIATWELLYQSEMAPNATIAEAVNLAANYSTANSAKFVNGVLAGIVRDISPS
ncbi:MAG: transcription antitermination factor NusB [Actinomycetota bacterium]